MLAVVNYVAQVMPLTFSAYQAGYLSLNVPALQVQMEAGIVNFFERLEKRKR